MADFIDSLMADLKDGGIAPGGRLGFYVKNLPEGAVSLVCRKVEEALDGLERYLAKNPDMASTDRRPELIVKLAALGLAGIAEMEPMETSSQGGIRT